MASNGGNGSSKRQSRAKSTAANRPKLKLTGEELYNYLYIREQKRVVTLERESVEKDIENRALKKRVMDLEMTLLGQKQSVLKQKGRDADKDLDLLRSEICQRLGIESMKDYILNTETLTLTHEKEA
jgi:hypothetical protein